jgi:hypothetical protein
MERRLANADHERQIDAGRDGVVEALRAGETGLISTQLPLCARRFEARLEKAGADSAAVVRGDGGAARAVAVGNAVDGDPEVAVLGGERSCEQSEGEESRDQGAHARKCYLRLISEAMAPAAARLLCLRRQTAHLRDRKKRPTLFAV